MSLDLSQMPRADSVAQVHVEDVVKTLGTASWFSLWQTHSVRLKAIEPKIIHLHPFQFLEVIFRKASKVSQYMPTIFKYNKLIVEFIKGLEVGLEKHNANTSKYLDSFAIQVKISPQVVQSCIHDGKIQELVQELIRIHCQRTS